jgi:hypothetical protein
MLWTVQRIFYVLRHLSSVIIGACYVGMSLEFYSGAKALMLRGCTLTESLFILLIFLLFLIGFLFSLPRLVIELIRSLWGNNDIWVRYHSVFKIYGNFLFMFLNCCGVILCY